MDGLGCGIVDFGVGVGVLELARSRSTDPYSTRAEDGVGCAGLGGSALVGVLLAVVLVDLDPDLEYECPLRILKGESYRNGSAKSSASESSMISTSYSPVWASLLEWVFEVALKRTRGRGLMVYDFVSMSRVGVLLRGKVGGAVDLDLDLDFGEGPVGDEGVEVVRKEGVSGERGGTKRYASVGGSLEFEFEDDDVEVDEDEVAVMGGVRSSDASSCWYSCSCSCSCSYSANLWLRPRRERDDFPETLAAARAVN